MPGWNLNEGQYQKTDLNEDELWQSFNYIFSTKSMNTTSYKFCFIKSILENVFNVDQHYILSFHDVFLKFTEIYWNLIVKFKLSQVNKCFNKSSVEIIIEDFCNKYAISDVIF